MSEKYPHHVGDVHLSDIGHDALLQLCWRFGAPVHEVLDGAVQTFSQFITGQIDQELTVKFPDRSAVRVLFLAPPAEAAQDSGDTNVLAQALGKLRYEVFLASDAFARTRLLPDGSAERMAALAADVHAVEKQLLEEGNG